MAITFDQKIKELEQKKSELDISFLQSKRQWYVEKIYEILEKISDKTDEIQAITTLGTIKLCHKRIKEFDQKIKNNPKLIEEIDKKIQFYQDRREKVKNITLYRDTAEWIAEIFWWDTIYQYAIESNNEELLNKITKRRLTAEEYTKIIEKDYPNFLKTKHEEYTKEMEKMYSELFWPILKKENKEQENTKTTIALPEWMSEQIKEELKTNKDIRPQDIEKFLKNELKKNAWEIMLSHIKNKFNDKYIHAYEYIRRLIINYPWFKITKNAENEISSNQTKTKREKLITALLPSKVEEEKENQLLLQILNIWKIENLDKRISIYTDTYEKLWHKFADKEDFAKTLKEMINIYTHIQLEREIQKTLIGIINNNIYPTKTEKYWYFAYKFSRSCDNWRIILYPNWEIFRLCSHNEYEKTINKQPPADKNKK